jgi:hypothetical protein
MSFINLNGVAHNKKFIRHIRCNENECNVAVFYKQSRCTNNYDVNVRKSENVVSYNQLKDIYDKTTKLPPIYNDFDEL